MENRGRIRNRTTVKGDTGKLLLDLGKLVFGSIVLGGILRGEVPQILLVFVGCIVSLIFCVIGLILVDKGKGTENIINMKE
jgi:hypothetical protein